MAGLGGEAWFTLAVVGLMLVGLVLEKLTPDVLVVGALVVLILAGILTPEQALVGFASSTMITVAALFVVAGALRNTGGLEFLSKGAFGRTETERGALTRLSAVAATSSAFLNNTPIVALFMPMVMRWSKLHGVAPSRLLIPLSYASIVGGVCTLIGTSTNLVVSGLLEQRGFDGIGMFELSPVAIPVAIAVISVTIALAPLLMPARQDMLAAAGEQARQYTVEMSLRGPSPLIGTTVEDAGLRRLPGLFLIRIERQETIVAPVGPGERLFDGDRLTFAGVVETIVDLSRFRGLHPETHDRPPEADDRWVLHEAVVSPGSPLVAKTIREANFRGRYNAAVVAVHRHGERIPTKIGDIVVRPGDTLLLEAAPGFARSFRDSTDFYLVTEVEESAPVRHHRQNWALVILAGVVLLGATGVLPVVSAALAGAIGVITVGCLSAGDARRSIDASTLLVIAASFGIGRALEVTGAAEALGQLVVGVGAGFGTMGVLIALYVVTVILTELVTNNAAAALMFPIALASAGSMGEDPRPFALVLAIAASMAFATPLGYQTNLMVYGPGGYRFSDFLRLGLPLHLLAAGLTLLLAKTFWLS